MSGVVRCDHCGAPHRREAARTRFRCDWCGGDNRVEVQLLAEDLFLAADDHTRDPATRVREALASHGIASAVLHPQPPRWVALWQIVNEDGEEFVAPVDDPEGARPVLRALPTGALRSVEDDPPRWAADLPPRAVPPGDHDAVVEAARATFDRPDSPVVLVRRVWIGVAEFLAGADGESLPATQILGTDRVVFERAPRARTTGPVNPARLAAAGAFLAGSIALGLAIDGPGLRAAAELAWLALGTFVWLLRRDVGRGVRA